MSYLLPALHGSKEEAGHTYLVPDLCHGSFVSYRISLSIVALDMLTAMLYTSMFNPGLPLLMQQNPW